MIKKQERYFSPLIFFLDCLSILFAYLLGASLWGRLSSFAQTYPNTGFFRAFSFYWDRYLLTLPLFFMIFVFFYDFWYVNRVLQVRRMKTMMLQTAIPCVLTGVIFVAFTLVNASFTGSIWFVLAFVVVAWLLLVADRMAVLMYLRAQQKKGNYVDHLLLVGTGERAVKAVRLFEANPGWGIQVVGFLTNERDEVGEEISGHKVVGLVDDLARILEANVVDTILFSGGTDSARQIRNLANRCEMLGIDFVLDVSTLLVRSMGVSAEPLQDISTILFRPIPYSPEKRFLKRVIDVAASAVLIVLSTPLWVLIPLFIKRDSPGARFLHSGEDRQARQAFSDFQVSHYGAGGR